LFHFIPHWLDGTTIMNIFRYALLLALATTTSASASSIGYELEITIPRDGGLSTPQLRLANLSTSSQITGFNLSIGDLFFHFESIYPGSQQGTQSFVLQPSLTGDGDPIVSDFLQVQFGGSGIASGLYSSFVVRLAPDEGDYFANFTQIFFNNEAAPNAVLSVQFANGRTLTQLLPNGVTPDNVYRFSQIEAAEPVSGVPEPSSFAMLAGTAAVAGLAMIRRRR
jgi:hypothetical protein